MTPHSKTKSINLKGEGVFKRKWSMLSLISGLIYLPAQAAPIENIDINGYFSFEYEQHVSGDNEGDLNGSFDLDLFDLVLNVDLTDRLRVATDLTWEHGTATEDNRGNVAVEYAFAEYSISDMVKFRAGKMFTHFGIYNEIHTAKPAILTVKEPLSTNKNNKLGSDFRFYPRWNTGVALLGNGEMGEQEFDYILQLSNGEDDQVNPYEEDANQSKALNGRLRFSHTSGLHTGISFYSDRLNHYDDVGSLDGKTEINSYSFQLEYEASGGFGIEGEYVAGTVKDYLGNDLSRFSYTVMFYQQFASGITPYYRFEQLEPNEDIVDDEAILQILGVNIPVDDNMYLKFELDQFTTQPANSEYNGADFVEFKASLSIGF